MRVGHVCGGGSRLVSALIESIPLEGSKDPNPCSPDRIAGIYVCMQEESISSNTSPKPTVRPDPTIL